MRVEIDNLSKRFDRTGEVLRDISLSIPAKSFVTIVGPSGCGKSTLLRMLAALDEPSAGGLKLDGRPLGGEGVSADTPGEVSYVFQEPRLLPWRRAAANIALPLELAGLPRAERQSRADAELQRVGLADFARAYPDELSGGMRMRVALARALVTKPALLLLDEPFGALDEITRETLNDELLRLWAKDGWTAVFVTHNMYEAVYLSERVLVMGLHPGRIVADIAVDLPYPRGPELRGDPAFSALVSQCSAALQSAHRADN